MDERDVERVRPWVFFYLKIRREGREWDSEEYVWADRGLY